MTDLWSFLLQTLTASGVAVLLLVVKAMFRDKLSPRWQFAVWSVLGLTLIVPAGLGGRYALINWPFWVEMAKSALTGEYGSLTRVIAPVPLPSLSVPRMAAEWLYTIYAAGVVLFLARYVLSYVRLRLLLQRGRPVENEQVREVAGRYELPVCPAVEVEGLSSAFVCGVLRPVMALPADVPVDDKVILHELLHLKHRDILWGLVICLFRCIHWCNPLLWVCAGLAGNDLEALCDQRVLERLEGEDRREYGRVLLSMADEAYARTPGTSSMANGGKNIRRRIQAIVRFKRYPAGMSLVSVCVILVLAAPLLVGVRSEAVAVHRTFSVPFDKTAALVSARTVRCTTCAGVFDAYAKAVLDRNLLYRIMCAPLDEQNALAAEYRQAKAWDEGTWEIPGLPWLNVQSGYAVYNVVPAGENAYEGLLVLELSETPPRGEGNITLAVRPLRAEKQGDRWVVLPQGDFWTANSFNSDLSTFPCEVLPAWNYEAKAEDFTLQMRYQTRYHVNSYVQSGDMFWSSTTFNITPRPGGTFNVLYGSALWAIYTGDPADKEKYTHIAADSHTLWEETQERPALSNPGLVNASSHSSDGGSWGGRSLEPGWDSPVFLSGGGTGAGGVVPELPKGYAVNFYLNGQLAAELTLLPVEGGPSYD